MFRIAFLPEANQKKLKREEYIWLPSKETYIVELFGTLCYELINLNEENLEDFIKKWEISELFNPEGKKIADFRKSKKINCNFKEEISKLKQYIKVGLGGFEEKETPIFGKSKEEKIKSQPEKITEEILEIFKSGESSFPEKEPEKPKKKRISPATLLSRVGGFHKKIPVKISVLPNFVMSDSTKWKIGHEYSKLEKQLKKINQKICSEEEKKTLSFCKGWENQEKISQDLENKREKIANEMMKIGHKENHWENLIVYETKSLLTLAWLETYTAANNNIEAKSCTCCGKVFILDGTRKITRCRYCRENEAKAWRAHQNK